MLEVILNGLGGSSQVSALAMDWRSVVMLIVGGILLYWDQKDCEPCFLFPSDSAASSLTCLLPTSWPRWFLRVIYDAGVDTELFRFSFYRDRRHDGLRPVLANLRRFSWAAVSSVFFSPC